MHDQAAEVHSGQLGLGRHKYARGVNMSPRWKSHAEKRQAPSTVPACGNGGVSPPLLPLTCIIPLIPTHARIPWKLRT